MPECPNTPNAPDAGSTAEPVQWPKRSRMSTCTISVMISEEAQLQRKSPMGICFPSSRPKKRARIARQDVWHEQCYWGDSHDPIGILGPPPISKPRVLFARQEGLSSEVLSPCQDRILHGSSTLSLEEKQVAEVTQVTSKQLPLLSPSHGADSKDTWFSSWGAGVLDWKEETWYGDMICVETFCEFVDPT